LQDGRIIKPCFAQTLMVFPPNPGSVSREFYHVVHHHPLLGGNGRLSVIRLEGGHEVLVQCHPTQKLCVRLDSINASVGDRDHGGDHLVLATAEW